MGYFSNTKLIKLGVFVVLIMIYMLIGKVVTKSFLVELLSPENNVEDTMAMDWAVFMTTTGQGMLIFLMFAATWIVWWGIPRVVFLLTPRANTAPVS